MARPAHVKAAAIAMLPHYLYEFRKGVRQLFLLTLSLDEATAVRERLEREHVAMHVQDVTTTKLNLYFGQSRFVEIARRIAVRPLHQLSPEEDFMLGILLGYEHGQQCQRYLEKVRAQTGSFANETQPALQNTRRAEPARRCFTAHLNARRPKWTSASTERRTRFSTGA